MKQLYTLLLLAAFQLAACTLYGQGNVTARFPVQAGADDAEESTVNGSMNLTSSDLELTRESTVQVIGIRFRDVNIPQGATINSAFIQFTVDETEQEPTNLLIEGEATDSSAIFTNEVNNLTNRSRTAAQVAWNDIPAWNNTGEAGPDQQSPDLTTIVNELVNRPGWRSGNAMTFIISGDGKRVAVSRNKDTGEQPVLVINYVLESFPQASFPIARESVWRYEDSGTPLDSTWNTLEFNDSSWAFGQGKLGFGDGNENTTLDFGGDPDNKHITTYFRKTFTVADPAAADSLTLELLRDDGAVVYLNGEEILRSNLPGGTVGFDTLATEAVGGAQEDQYFTFQLPAEGLQEGLNLLAVEVHQHDPASSDLGFDLALSGKEVLPPAVQLIHNSPDPSLATVDIYVDLFNQGNFVNFTQGLPVPFRIATDYITDLPAGTHRIAVSPFGQEDFEWSATEFTVENNKRYIVMATGVRDTTQFNTSVNGGEAIAFKFIINEVPDPEIVSANETLPLLSHGVPDLPNIRIIAIGAGDATEDFPEGLPYGFDLAGGEVDALPFPRVQVTNNEVTEIFGAYKVDLTPFAGQVITVVASGFLSPEGNTGVSESNFGLFVVPGQESPFIELPAPDPPQPGKVQILHNSPDPELSQVDIYVNGELAFEDLAYRAATGFLDIPAGANRVAVSPAGVVDTAWSAFDFEVETTLNVQQFREDGLPYIAVAHGVRNEADFTNEANSDVGFGIAAVQARLEASNDNNADFIVFHGGVDAPEIDIILEGELFPIVNDLGFGNFSSTYLSLPADDVYTLNLTDRTDNDEVIKAFDLALQEQGGKVFTLLASGLLEAEEGQDPFALLLADDSTGFAQPLPELIVDQVRDISEAGIEIYPNPVKDILRVTTPRPIDQLSVISLAGQTLAEYQAVQSGRAIDLSDLPVGAYVLRLRVDGEVFRKRIVVAE